MTPGITSAKREWSCTLHRVIPGWLGFSCWPSQLTEFLYRWMNVTIVCQLPWYTVTSYPDFFFFFPAVPETLLHPSSSSFSNKGLLKGTVEHRSFLVYCLNLSFRRRQWHPTPVLLPGKSHGWRSLVGCSPKSRTRLSDFTLTFHFHALEKETATHSSVLAWRTPGTAEPCGLPSVGSHRVGHDWSDLAAAAAAASFKCICYHWVFYVAYASKPPKFNSFPKMYSALCLT